VRHLKVGIVDLVATERCSSVYARMMFPHFASIMPQAVAVWCAEAGHRVTFVCYTGEGDVIDALPADLDIVFICAFTHAALLAYAASAYYRSKGAITILGGPHARAYPAHARRYFDYVLGLTDRALIVDLLGHCAPERPFGRYLTCAAQPRELPSIRDRWPYLAELHRRAIAPTVALIGSLGCPYTCSFCVDAPIPYQPLDYDTIRNDLRFLLTRFRRPRVGWHDPNFGVRFDEYMDVIEEAVPSGSIEFGAETSLSLLSEPRLRRLKHNGFRVMISGIESWYDHGNKSRTGTKSGSVKMRELVEHAKLVLRYIPYLQANFVLGLDTDEGSEPFELTKRFIDLVPGVFPASAMLTAYGESAPLSRQLQQEGRVLAVPFQFLTSGHVSNVRPKHYSWDQFYAAIVDLLEHSFSWRSIYRRDRATDGLLLRSIHLARAISLEGRGRAGYVAGLLERLRVDQQLRRFLDGETGAVPGWMAGQIKGRYDSMWKWMPADALSYDATGAADPGVDARSDSNRVMVTTRPMGSQWR